jgi:hypothetical protein
MSKFLVMEDALKYWLIPLFVLLSSCSLFETARESVNGDEARSRSMKVVSQAQYDDLLEKYKKLKSDHERLKENRTHRPTPSTLTEELMLNTAPVVSGSSQVEKVVVDTGLGTDELTQYHQAVKIKNSGDLQGSLKIFKNLEKSTNQQISVRARFRQGEVLMILKEFDLAMQVFERIVDSNAYSIVTIDALKSAAICAEKLGVMDKRDQYLASLRDVFGISI